MGNQKKIMIIGAGAGQVPIINESKRNGLYTIVVSPNGPYPGIQLADLHINEDIYNKEILCEYARKENIDFVISDQSDFAVPIVAYIAEKLNLPGNKYSTAVIYSNKNKQRDFCLRNNLKVPQNYKINNAEEIFNIEIPFPWVIKPADSQGSRGILKVNNIEEALKAYEEAISYSKVNEVIIEEFFRGREIVCEGIVIDGEYMNIGFGDREYFKLENKFIPSKTIFPSTIDEKIKKKLIEHETRFTRLANARFGIVHAEYLINTDGNFCLVETALRGGGVYISSHLIPNTYGIDLTKILIDYLLRGTEYVKKYLTNSICSKTSSYICFYIDNGIIYNVEGIEAIHNNKNIIQADIGKYTKGYKYNQLIHKGDRLGPILIVANNREELNKQINWLYLNYRIYMESSPKINSIKWE